MRVLVCAEPLAAATTRIASTAYCLLFKLCTMQVTRSQMCSMLNHKDSPYIRALGFLFLRYTAPPADLWEWYEPFLDDLQMFTPGADRSRQMYVDVGHLSGWCLCSRSRC
jgi:pre-mRNA-splicing factor 38B